MAGPWEEYGGSPSLTELPWAEYAVQQQPESQRLRSAAQGLTFGLADELEALARSVVPGSPNYETVRNEIRAKLKAYQEANPAEAITYEVLGAAAPTVLAMMTGIGAEPALAAQGERLAGIAALKQAAKLGAVQGGIAGYGTGEKGVVEDIAGIPGGAIVGAGAGAGTTAALRPVGSLATKFMDFARQRLGDKGAGIVNTEIQRIADDTGLSYDEIVQRIADGEIMAENETVLSTVRAYRSKGGPGAAAISEKLPARRAQTRAEAMQSLQQGLSPEAGVTDNVYRMIRMDEEAFRKRESDAYNAIFRSGQEVSSGTVDSISEALIRAPGIRAHLDEIYQGRGKLVPFYKIDENGAIKIVRAPNVEDAEIVRRALDELASTAYKGSKGTLGDAIKELEQNLRRGLNVDAPNLAQTRANWATLSKAKEAFEYGRKAAGKNADEVEVEWQKVVDSADPAAMKAFRAGVMDSFRNKARRQPGLMRNLADPERQEGAILRIVFPENQIDDTVATISRAAKSQRAADVVMGGSMTAPEQAAGARIGERLSAQEAARAAQGDPTAIISVGAKMVKSMLPQMGAKQREEVVNILLSENPDLVRKALFDTGALGELQKAVGRIGNRILSASERAASFEFGGGGGTISQGLLGPVMSQEQQ
jgi:hypothetical protein